MNEIQNIETKVENGGTTPQGRVSAAEFNIITDAAKRFDVSKYGAARISEGGQLQFFADAASMASYEADPQNNAALLLKSLSLPTSDIDISGKLDKAEFYRYFEEVNIGTASEPKYAIHAKYGLYTDSFLSALGLNPDTGGGGGGGATALSELSDVQLSGLLTGDVLIYDGTHWVNRPQSSIVPDLSEYATRTWVQQQGFATTAALTAHAGDATIHISSAERTLWNKTAADFAAIVGADSDDIINKWEEVVAFLDTYTEADTLANLLSNKVDKVTGYGLSKNDFTDALLSKLNGIEAGANRYIHPTGGADAAIADAAGRVLAGITVNALGHVTSVSSKTLAAADIPTLSISKVSGLQDALDGKLDAATFDDLFEKVNIGTTSAPKYAIRAKYGLYADGFLSSLGLNSSGGGGGGGATALSELSDVQLSGLLTGDVLIYDGTHWVNRPQSSIVPDLSEYATRTWVQQQGFATTAALTAHAGDATIHISSAERTLWNKTAADFAAIVGADSDDIINKWEEVVAFLDTYTEADTLANLLSNKVDKVTGYGLSKNDFTDALLSKLNGIEAGANRYIHPTGGADAAIADAAGRVLAGITVNALGHVTSVSSKTLAAADIPTLSISKVSGLQDALDGKLDAATFDDLFEKVNIGTTSAPKYAIRAKYGLYADGFLSSLGLNSSGGGGGGASYDRLDLWSDYTSERAGWVLSAGLGYELHSRVRSLEGGSALSFTTEGSGNVVTAVKKSGTAVVVTKGLTALTSHQPIYALNFQAGAFEAKKYTPNTGAQTVNIPTKTSHLSNDSGFITSAALTGYATQSWVKGLGYITASALTPYITAATANATFATKLGIDGNQIGTYVGGKLGNLITVPYAANADKWDGEQLSSFRLRKRYTLDLTSLSESNFYPVVFSSQIPELDCEIRSTSSTASAAYNQNNIHYLLTSQGWSDTPRHFVILSQGNYDDSEITIGAVGYGLCEGMTCVWLRGGLTYYFISNRIPTLKTSDYTYGSEVYTVGTALSGGTNKNVYVVWKNDDSRTNKVVALQGGTVASATNANNSDTLDGYHEASFFRDQRGEIQEADLDTFASRSSGTYRIALSSYKDSMAVFKSPLSAASALELRFRYTGMLWARFSADANRYTTDWKQIAFTDSNVASATKLKTARTIWGQSFDGTGNVDGVLNITGIGNYREGIRLHKVGTLSSVWFNAVNSEGFDSGMFGITVDGTGMRFRYGTAAPQDLVNITNNGNVGIGTTAPAYKLDVDGATRINDNLYLASYGTNYLGKGTGDGAMWTTYNVKLHLHYGMVIADNADNINFLIDARLGNFSAKGTIYATKGIWSDGYMSAKGINTASDVRLKRRIADVALTVRDVAEAPVYRFAWINGGGIDVGSTAQYWAARVPELTHLLADGIHLGLDYGKAAVVGLVPVAKATLANTRDIAEHGRQLKELDSRIAAIERQLQNRTI